MKTMIIRAGALGDTLMLMPAIKQLNSHMEISILGRHPGIGFLRPYVAECMNFESSGWHDLFIKNKTVDIGRVFPKTDRVIAFLNDSDGILEKSLSLHFPNAEINIFPPFPNEDKKIHIALYMAQCLESIGLPLDSGVSISESLKHPVFEQINHQQKRLGIVFHPGSGSKKKNYSREFWLDLIDRISGLQHFKEYSFFILLGPAEEDRYTFYKQKIDPRKMSIIMSPGVDDLLSLMGRTRIFIGHDSGVTHLAAMSGVMTIDLFRSSSVENWKPLGPDVSVIRLSTEGAVIEDIIKKIVIDGS